MASDALSKDRGSEVGHKSPVGAKRATTAVAKLAGPEVAAASTAVKAAGGGKPRASGPQGAGAGGQRGGRPADARRPTAGRRDSGGGSPLPDVGHWSGKGSNPRRALVAEFVVCLLILLLAPLSAKHAGDDVHAWVRRWMGLSGLFLMLALAATASDRVGRIAAASGLVVTLALLFNDGDVFTQLMSRIAIPQPKPGQTLPIPGVQDGTITNTGDGGWIVGSGTDFSVGGG